MDFTTLLKYLEFIKQEALRHSRDKKVNKDELNIFKIEIQRFLDLLTYSQLSEELKVKVNSIDFSLNPIAKNKELKITSTLFGNRFTNNQINEENLANAFISLSERVEALMLEIQTSY